MGICFGLEETAMAGDATENINTYNNGELAVLNIPHSKILVNL